MPEKIIIEFDDEDEKPVHGADETRLIIDLDEEKKKKVDDSI